MCWSILAFVCPPLAVGLKRGCGSDFFAAFCLTCLFWLPGCCYACCIVHADDDKRGRVTQVTHINMAPAQVSPPQHVAVNMNEPYRQQPLPQPYPYTGHYPPLPQQDFQHLPSAPTAAPMSQGPPPMYSK